MEQNKPKCLDCMEKIKKKLEDNKFDILMTSNRENILCKVSEDWTDNTKPAVVKTVNTASSCPHTLSTKCPYSTCMHPNTTCPHHNTENGTTNDSNGNNGIVSELSSIGGCTLFRIFPNDIYSGLFLHVIILHGEVCDLKMSFEYNENGIADIINIIKFLA